MPLEQLYNSNPLQTLGQLPLGYQGSMYRTLMEQYGKERQLQDVYNKQVTEQMNPALIEHQNLANQQQQYMMPTYEAQGMEAKAKMNTPNYYGAKAGSELAGFGATQAENVNKQATAEAQAPFVKPTVTAQAQTGLDIAALDRMIAAVTTYNGNDPEEAKAMLTSLNPKVAKWLNPVIDQKGIEPARELFLTTLIDQKNRLAQIDPKHVQEMAKQELIGRQQLATASVKQQAEKEFEAFVRAYKAANPKASDYDAMTAWISSRYQPSSTQQFFGPENDLLFTQVNTKGGSGGGKPAAKPGQPAAPAATKTITIKGKQYEVLFVDKNGTYKVRDPQTGRTGSYKP